MPLSASPRLRHGAPASDLNPDDTHHTPSQARSWRPAAAACAVLLATACSAGPQASPSPSVNPYAVAASRAAAQASASASSSAAASTPPTPTQAASQPPSLSPEAQASREKALSTPVPQRIPGMDDNTPQGAGLTGEYLLKLYTYTYTTGDTGPWKEMTEEGCVFCKSVTDNATALHDEGGWADHWDFEIHTIKYGHPSDVNDTPIVDIEFTNPGTIRYDYQGNAQESQREDHHVLRISMRHAGGRWKIYEAGDPQ